MLDDQSSVLEAAQKTNIESAKSNGYSTQYAPGVTIFNQKPNKRPRLPRSWIGWNSNAIRAGPGQSFSRKLRANNANSFASD
jgi:hypothetical protein